MASEGDRLHLSLGNVSQNGILMRNERFARAQERMKQDFIRFMQRPGAPRFTIIDETLLSDGYRILIRYDDARVDIASREEIKRAWKGVRISTEKDMDSFVIPFKRVNLMAIGLADLGLFAALILIMVMCVYIQMLNKPQRYGEPGLSRLFSQER